jgi:hypothetical protein
VATFDQLPAEQRAIIELVVARGRTYDALADVLQVPAERVRELARDALAELAPVTAERVDPQWRGQVADYLLGQQSSAESTATRAHLKRSESARAWALSLLDALDTLYANGDRPAIPDADAAAAEPAEVAEKPPRERKRERERTAALTEEEPERERELEREPEREKPAPKKKPAAAEAKKAPVAGRSVLSPAAQSALRRRRIIGGAIGLVVLAAIVVGILALTGVFGGDDDSGSEASAGGSGDTGTQTTGGSNQQPQVLGQIPLKALKGTKAQGTAYILEQGGERVLAVTAKLPPLPATQRKAAYNVWLFNSPKDSESIGAQFTTPQGDYQGVGKLPENFERFKFIDVSRQPFNNKTGHSGDSVLRGAVADLKQVPQGQQAPGQQGQQVP